MYPIRDYFLIGDLHTAALVSRKASIDWLCLPHFDSPSVFAGLIDKHGGTFAVETSDYEIVSSYRSDTAIVEHEFNNNVSAYSLYDFMLPQAVNECDNHFLIRKFIGRKGISSISLRFDPQPDYGRATCVIEEYLGTLKIKLEKYIFVLHVPTDAEVTRLEDGYSIKFSLLEGNEALFVLEYGVSKDSGWNDIDFEIRTEHFWHDWVTGGHFFSFCRDQLVRSAITLKLMQFYPTGAIVAAPTTSLPEEIGGERNWDYRYVWIRDATFTLYAFYVLGYTGEAVKFFEFIERIAEDSDHDGIDVHLMYTIWGHRVPHEEILNHVSGYFNSHPVRIGNDATNQFQLDVYGSLIDAHYFMAQRGVHLTERSKRIVLAMFEKIKENWQTPDNGIWEVRSGRQHFTYSKVMAWVGINRGLALCSDLAISEQKRNEMSALQNEIRTWVWDNCFDRERNILRQHPDTLFQDATNFLLVVLKFLDKHEPLTKLIVDNTARELVKQNVFVDRYHTSDGLFGDEGAFVLCSFWYISALAIIGEVEKAQELFDTFSIYIDKSGLLSEEIDERSNEYLGNYPQAFSHMGYIMTAYYLQRYNHTKK